MYGGTKTEMERLISDANEYAESIGQAGDMSIDSFADVVRAIELVQEKQGIAGTTAREASSTIQGSLNMVKGAWTNLVAGISNPDADIGQLISDLIESGKAALENLLPTIKQATTGIVQLVRDVAPLIAEELPSLVEELLPMVLDTATSLLNGLISALPTLIDVLVQQVPAILDSIINTALSLLPQIIQLGLTLITSLAQGIAESLPTLIPTIIDVILEIVDILTDPDNLITLVEAAIQIMIALTEGIINALPRLIEKIPTIIINIGTTLVKEAPRLIATGLYVIGRLTAGIIEAIPQIIAQMPKIIAAMIKGLLAKGKELLNVGKKVIGFVRDGIKSVVSKAAEWGKDLVKNFISGIKSKFGAIGDAMSNFGNTIKSFIHFSEPDVGPLSDFHTYAPDMMDLFIKGIKDGEKRLQDTVASAFDFQPIISSTNEGLSTPSVSTTAGSSVTINVYGAKGQDVNELAEIVGRKINKDIRRNQEVWA